MLGTQSFPSRGHETVSAEEILQGIKAYHPPGDVIELRIPYHGGKGALIGYYSDYLKLAQDAEMYSQTREYTGIYISINPVNPILLARANNRTQKGVEGSKAEDILELRWLPIDADVIKPRGISSTDCEHEMGLAKAAEIRRWLISKGWPDGAFVPADSGNGAHISARIAPLPNTPENVKLLKHCLEVLHFIFTDKNVKIDTGVFDAPRIWKLPGTWVCKGEDLPERPHRKSKLLEQPEDVAYVTRAQLEALVKMGPKGATSKDRVGKDFDAVKYAEDHGLKVHGSKIWNGRTLVILEKCPFDSSHNRGEATIGQHPGGARFFNCFHDSCQSKNWHDLKALFEPDKAEESEEPLLLEKALLYLDSRCDSATSVDGQGFTKFDAQFGKAMAEKVKSGQKLTKKEYRDSHAMLKKYNTKQLSPAGFDWRLIPEKPPEDDEEDGGEGDSTSKSVATRMVEMAMEEGAELWHDPDEEPYVTIPRNGHLEHHPLRVKAIRLWLSSLMYKQEGRSPGSQATQDALNVLEGKALFEGPEHEVYVRVAPYEDRVYVDLGGDDWNYVEICAGGWQIVREAPVRFRRPKTLKPLPVPVSGGKWEDFRALVNAADDRTWILIVSWLTQAFWPKGPYAHLNFAGEQGSGKTMVQEMCKCAIDPSATVLRRPPKDERDLMIAASNERVPSFDNLSGMPKHLSDAFCGLSTGVALATRSLYTDAEETFMVAKRPCIMNGIDTLTHRGDLLDRTITVDLPRIKKVDRKLEKKIMAAFAKIQPQLLGLILNATATGLKRDADVTEEGLPRMADFCQWVIACEPALPMGPGEFMKAYVGQAEDALTILIDSDKFATAVYQFAVSLALEKQEKDTIFKDSATELLEKLNKRDSIHSNDARIPKGWPKSAGALSSHLRRVAPALRSKGVEVEWIKETSGDKKIKLWFVGNNDRRSSGDVSAIPKSKIAEGEPGGSDGVRRFGGLGDKIPDYSVQPCDDEITGNPKDAGEGDIGIVGKKIADIADIAEPLEAHTDFDAGDPFKNIAERSPKRGQTSPKPSKEPEKACLACGDDIDSGHGNYYNKYCASCGPKLPMVSAAAKALPEGFLTSKLWEDLALRGRAPKKEHLPGMLRHLGYIEDGAIWMLPKDFGSLEQVKLSA
jgi:hypothetical protein